MQLQAPAAWADFHTQGERIAAALRTGVQPSCGIAVVTMAEISVDATQWPLVFVTLPAEAADEDVRRYLGQLRLLRERRQAYALVIDANRSRGFTAPQRQMQAEYIASGVELSRKYLKALAFVASSAMQRGMLTAVFWLRRPESPYRVFSTRTEAQAWATTMLAPAAAAP